MSLIRSRFWRLSWLIFGISCFRCLFGLFYRFSFLSVALSFNLLFLISIIGWSNCLGLFSYRSGRFLLLSFNLRFLNLSWWLLFLFGQCFLSFWSLILIIIDCKAWNRWCFRWCHQCIRKWSTFLLLCCISIAFSLESLLLVCCLACRRWWSWWRRLRHWLWWHRRHRWHRVAILLYRLLNWFLCYNFLLFRLWIILFILLWSLLLNHWWSTLRRITQSNRIIWQQKSAWLRNHYFLSSRSWSRCSCRSTRWLSAHWRWTLLLLLYRWRRLDFFLLFFIWGHFTLLELQCLILLHISLPATAQSSIGTLLKSFHSLFESFSNFGNFWSNVIGYIVHLLYFTWRWLLLLRFLVSFLYGFPLRFMLQFMLWLMLWLVFWLCVILWNHLGAMYLSCQASGLGQTIIAAHWARI